MMKQLLLIICTLLVCACTKTTEESTNSGETFADPQIEAYQKAQQVEGLLLESEADRRKRIDAE